MRLTKLKLLLFSTDSTKIDDKITRKKKERIFIVHRNIRWLKSLNMVRIKNSNWFHFKR